MRTWVVVCLVWEGGDLRAGLERRCNSYLGGILSGLECRYRVVRAGNGSWTIRDEEVKEVYHPEMGMLGECRAWLDQPEIEAVLGATDMVRIWDVGLGAGGVVAACWERLRGRTAHVVSFDRTVEALARVLEHRDKFPHLAVLPEAVWERRLWPGRVVWEGNVWDWIEGDIRETWMAVAAEVPGLVMFDMHSPQVQPELWGLDFWRRLGEWMVSKRVLVAFHTRSTAVRVTLLLAGWWVGRGVALGSKEETTLAASVGGMLSRPLGREWLGRVERSTAGHPLDGSINRPQRITEEWMGRLRAHPQFL